MERTAVKSSFIKSIGHDPVNNVLEVELAHGVYRYANVTAEEAAALMAAESLGKHFGQFIKSRPSTKEPASHVQPSR